MLKESLTLKFIVILAFIFLGCERDAVTPGNPEPRELTTLEKNLVQSENKFGLKLFREIVAAEKDTNIFISPLSVSMALGMTLNGANGATFDAMQSTLEFTGMTTQEINESYHSLREFLLTLDSRVLMNIANSIWYKKGYHFQQEFIDLNKNYFDAEVTDINFSDPDAADRINGWIEDNTNGKIKDMIESPIDPLVVMYLINAIYFKGTWTYQFDEKMTYADWFNLPNGTRNPIQMMAQTNDFQYLENDQFQAISLPYGDKRFCMTVFLPQNGVDIDVLIAQFTPENWSLWSGQLKTIKGTLLLPRFNLKYKLLMNDVLKALGMSIAFSGAADFTKMYAPGDLYISRVLHQSFVEVNEEGTEAAAATVVEMKEYANANEFMMRVDRPFIFVIGENISQTILFIGKVMDINS